MKRYFLIPILFLATAAFAGAQSYGAGGPATDVLGAHLNYGRGCAACHAPHSGAYGNGAARTADSTSGNVALWGQDVASLYGKSHHIRPERQRLGNSADQHGGHDA